MPKSFTLEPFGRVCEVIESWRPRGCKTEKDYENSLVKKLRKELVNQTTQQQYGSARQKVDIMVHDKVPIEIKKDLNSTAKLQRAKGQLDGYLKVWERVILVVCGDTPADLFNDLKKYAKSQSTFSVPAGRSDRVYLYKV